MMIGVSASSQARDRETLVSLIGSTRHSARRIASMIESRSEGSEVPQGTLLL